jgi:hypothetical protein
MRRASEAPAGLLLSHPAGESADPPATCSRSTVGDGPVRGGADVLARYVRYRAVTTPTAPRQTPHHRRWFDGRQRIRTGVTRRLLEWSQFTDTIRMYCLRVLALA